MKIKNKLAHFIMFVWWIIIHVGIGSKPWSSPGNCCYPHFSDYFCV